MTAMTARRGGREGRREVDHAMGKERRKKGGRGGVEMWGGGVGARSMSDHNRGRRVEERVGCAEEERGCALEGFGL